MVIIYTNILTNALSRLCMHFLNIRDIILVGDNIIMLLS